MPVHNFQIGTAKVNWPQTSRVVLPGPSVAGSWIRPRNDRGIGIVVVENLPEIRARLGHRSRARLAEPDAVAFAFSFEEHLAIVVSGNEVVAGYDGPAETAIKIQP